MGRQCQTWVLHSMPHARAFAVRSDDNGLRYIYGVFRVKVVSFFFLLFFSAGGDEYLIRFLS